MSGNQQLICPSRPGRAVAHRARPPPPQTDGGRPCSAASCARTSRSIPAGCSTSPSVAPPSCRPSPSTSGERVVAYFDHVGGIEGTVVRAFDGGFAFKIDATQHKREKLAAQLTWLANRSELEATSRPPPRARRPAEQSAAHAAAGRRHRPQLPRARRLHLRRLDRHAGAARDRHRGHARASCARASCATTPQGFGVQFLDIQNPTALRRYFG